MGLIAEAAFDLAYSAKRMSVRVFAPEQDPGGEWQCLFEIDDPISVRRAISGETSLQALFLAMKTLSAHLYGSDLYRERQLGIFGQFGVSLSIPAPQVLLDIAPYPF